MNGFALLVALSSLGVDYNVQTSEDGKLEYVIQIEPEVLRLMAEGQQIHSDVPPDAGAIERVLVRVGLSAAKHSQAHIAEYRRLLVQGSRFASVAPGQTAPDAAAAILWPAKSKPELSYNVTTGYQPDSATGVQTYFVQLNSTLMQSLQVGDEIRAAVDPAAGKVGRFVILAGNSELPKVPIEPVATIAPRCNAGCRRRLRCSCDSANRSADAARLWLPLQFGSNDRSQLCAAGQHPRLSHAGLWCCCHAAAAVWSCNGSVWQRQ
jgi:hypothetical protein